MSTFRVRRRDQFGDDHEYGLSTLELNGPEFELEIKLLSKQGKRERRTVLRSFLRQIRPWLRHFEKVSLDHSPSGMIRSKRSHERGFKEFASNPISTRPGAMGYAIRMRRLKLGLSQAELARKLAIRRPHLSGIERGLHLPRAKMRTAIENVLGIQLSEK